MAAKLEFRHIVRSVEDRLQVNALTYEYEILSCFFDHVSLTANQISERSRASSTTFFKTLRGLEKKGVLCSEENAEDRRSKIYRLTDFARNVMMEDRFGYSNWYNVETYGANDEGNALHTYSKNIKGDLGIKHLTCDYQIIMYLYRSAGLKNIEFTDLVDVSSTKFNNSLKNLTEMGLIYSEKDLQDKRNKHYYLSDWVREVIDEAQRLIYQWVCQNPLLKLE